jgi:protein-L-isoaspartate(D-aspartate) O-methyltransferase
VILVSAGAPEVPQALVEQLDDPGRMLIPVGSRDMQDLVLIRKEDGQTTRSSMQLDCRFVPLLGRQGWSTEGPKE